MRLLLYSVLDDRRLTKYVPEGQLLSNTVSEDSF